MHAHIHMPTQIQHEIKALATLDDVSDDEVFELSTMAGASRTSSSTRSRAPSTSQQMFSTTDIPPLPTTRRRFHSLVRFCECSFAYIKSGSCL